ncbi:FAD-dependent oxidoreductase, partial [Mycobacteroides abscessus]|uniref:FAD-dependent oxidoreductase n=1 Tax=Mycobacteroides abscessus TaxID=36809 RepID=UPI00373FC8E5
MGAVLHRHRHGDVRRVQLERRTPAFVGGMTYYDAQVDDARYVASLVRTAASYGAHAAARVRIEGFIKVGERVVGAHAHDIQTGEKF